MGEAYGVVQALSSTKAAGWTIEPMGEGGSIGRWGGLRVEERLPVAGLDPLSPFPSEGCGAVLIKNSGRQNHGQSALLPDRPSPAPSTSTAVAGLSEYLPPPYMDPP